MKDDLFIRHLAQTNPYPIGMEVDRSEGIYIYDKQRKAYMDMVSGIGVSNVGHGLAQVKQALKNQIDKHLHVMVYGEFRQEAQEKFAALLCDVLPKELDTCYFVNSGTEANEAALKLAKRVTGRYRLLAFKGSYHGSTHGSMSVSANETKKSAFRPLLPDVYFMRLNSFEDLEMITNEVAAVILETVQGDAGVRSASPEFMLALRQKCNETGTLLILDEIQCGMGRTGTLFAFEQYGIVPDILTLGKALGGGLPIGAFVASRKNMELLSHNPVLGHITTFGGHPLPCASGYAALKYMLDERLIDEVEAKGKLIEDLLKPHKAVKEIRRRGLMLAIDLENADVVQRIVENCLENGLITFWFLSCPHSFRLAPPLTISEKEIRMACEVILASFDKK